MSVFLKAIKNSDTLSLLSTKRNIQSGINYWEFVVDHTNHSKTKEKNVKKLKRFIDMLLPILDELKLRGYENRNVDDLLQAEYLTLFNDQNMKWAENELNRRV